MRKMDLKERCAPVVMRLQDAALSTRTTLSDQIDYLVEFVLAEIGRSKAAGVLDRSYPAVAYFKTETDREEFIKAITEANPNIRAKAVL
jgi:hypothetical protein